MATLKQILKAHGFQHKSSSTYSERWALRHNREWAGKSYVRLEIRPYERNASQVVVVIGGKKSEIWFGYNKNGANAPTAKQLERFEALVTQCKEAALYEAANPVEKAPRKSSPPRPALTAVEKFDNAVYRWLGDFYVCGYIGKDFRQYLYYHKAGGYIQVADTENVMAYALIRQKHFDEANLPFTIATFEEWLLSQGIKKKKQKRVKRSYSLYD